MRRRRLEGKKLTRRPPKARTSARKDVLTLAKPPFESKRRFPEKMASLPVATIVDTETPPITLSS